MKKHTIVYVLTIAVLISILSSLKHNENGGDTIKLMASEPSRVAEASSSSNIKNAIENLEKKLEKIKNSQKIIVGKYEKTQKIFSENDAYDPDFSQGELEVTNLEEEDYNEQRQSDVVEAYYFNESVDETWKTQAELTLETSLNSNTDKEIDVDCRSTMCRITFTKNNSTEESSFSGFPAVPWDFQGYAEIDPDNGSHILYVSRDGYELPISKPDA